MLLTEAEKERELMRANAIKRSGHKFFLVTLGDSARRRIAGVYVVNAYPVDDHRNHKIVYNCKVEGGELQFTRRVELGGEYAVDVLDCEHNRKFFASHFGGGYFHIEDEDIRKDIESRYKKLCEQIAKKSTVHSQPFTMSSNPEKPAIDISKMSPDEVSDLHAKLSQMKTLQEESAKHPVRPQKVESPDKEKAGDGAKDGAKGVGPKSEAKSSGSGNGSKGQSKDGGKGKSDSGSDVVSIGK